jgi:hypothetical protein
VHAGDGRADRLAQDEDHEQAEAIREVLEVERDVTRVTGRDRRGGDVDEHRDRPEDV